MADSILDTVSAAYEGLANPDADPPSPPVDAPVADAPAEPVAETAQQAADRARDEQGRFAKQPKERAALAKEPRETLKLKAKPQEAPSPGVTNAGTLPNAVSGVPAAPLPPEIAKDGKHLARIPPPQGWDGLSNLHWDRIPRPVKETITKEYATVEQAKQDLLPVRELLDVNREFLVNQAGSVGNAMTQMMQFARMSVDSPVQLAEHILRSKGLDPRAVFSGQPQAAAQDQPQDVQTLLAQLVDQRLQPILAERDQQQTQQLQTTIDEFARSPERPFFNDVRMHMGKLIQAGLATSLEDAYQQATWANPTIRAHLEQGAREAAEKANAATVQKARAAQRTSVTGSPIAGVEPSGGRSKGSALDAVRQAYADLSEG